MKTRWASHVPEGRYFWRPEAPQHRVQRQAHGGQAQGGGRGFARFPERAGLRCDDVGGRSVLCRLHSRQNGKGVARARRPRGDETEVDAGSACRQGGEDVSGDGPGGAQQSFNSACVFVC